MTTYLWIGGALLVGFWVAETVLFLLSYRSSTRAESARAVKSLT